jgi:hypothetical protein
MVIVLAPLRKHGPDRSYTEDRTLSKRNPYDIAALSQFPDEEEGIFPFACTFKVRQVEEAKGLTTISLHSVDCY